MTIRTRRRLALFVTAVILAAAGAAIAAGAFSPLPGAIAFLGCRGPDDWGIYLLNPRPIAWHRPSRVTPEGVIAGHFAWSPDGTRLAFRCEIKDGAKGICLIDRDGSGFSLLISEAESSYQSLFAGPLAWSPDAENVIFGGRQRWYTVSVATGETRPLGPGLPVQSYVRAISLAPDGATLAVEAYDHEIHLIDLETSETRHVSWGLDAARLPHSDWLAVAGLVPFKAIDADGSKRRELFAKDGICVSPNGLSWSPDRRYIAFVGICGESDPAWLYAYDVRTGRAHRVLRSGWLHMSVVSPAWAPDA